MVAIVAIVFFIVSSLRVFLCVRIIRRRMPTTRPLCCQVKRARREARARRAGLARLVRRRDRRRERGEAHFLGTKRNLSAYWTGHVFLEDVMNGLIYLIGLIVVILAILSFFGLR
jgi:hypothetical protein